MAESNKKITWQPSGSTKSTKFVNAASISELKKLSESQKAALLSSSKKPNVSPKNLTSSGITPTIVNSSAKTGETKDFKTVVDQIKNNKTTLTKIMSGFTLNNTTKTATAPHTPIRVKPSGLTKSDSTKFTKSASTVYQKSVSGNTKNLAKVSLSQNSKLTEFISGTVDFSFPSGQDYGFDGDVLSIVIQPDGKILVGGDFGYYYSPDYPSGYYSPYLIRLNADGTVDDSFASGYLNGDVRTIALQSDGKILIGGWFTYEDYYGNNVGRILRLNSNGSPDLTFVQGNGFNSGVYSIQIQKNGKILVGGFFYQYNGNTSNHIVRLNSDGTRDTSFVVGNGFNGAVYAIEVQSDGKVIVGGDFYDDGYYDNNKCNSIVRLNSDGSLENTFGFGFDNGYVTSISIQSDGKILVGGGLNNYYPYYNDYTNFQISNVVRFNSDCTFDYSFYYTDNIYNSDVYTLTLQSDNKILVGGNFYDDYLSGYNLRRFGRLNNYISKYKYVYLFKSDCQFNPETYSVGSNTLLTYNENNGSFFSFVNLKNSTDVKCGYLILNPYSYLYPNAIPEYELVTNYNTDLCGPCLYENTKYVRALNLYDPGDIIDLNVNKNFVVGDIFFLEDTYLQINSGVRGCFQITEELSFDTSPVKVIPYVPYKTCEECVQENGLIYVGINSDTYDETFFISHQYINPEFFNGTNFYSVILPNTTTPCNFIVDNVALYTLDDARFTQLPVVFSTKVFEEPFFGMFPYCVECQSALGSGELDLTFNNYYDVNRGFNDSVYTTKIKSDGKIVVGGDFYGYNGEYLSYGQGITVLNTDGSIDTTFNPPYSENRYIYSVDSLSNGDIIMGGEIITNNILYDYGWNYEFNGDGDIYTNNGKWIFEGPNDNNDDGWSYAKHQFTEDGSITFDWSYSTSDEGCCDWGFYYVGQNEPVGDTNIDFEQNQFGFNTGDKGSITINYSAGDWVSIGVYSNDSDLGAGILSINLGTYLFKVDKYGNPDTTFNNNILANGGFSGDVYKVYALSNGKLIVAGDFAEFNGYQVFGFVKLNSDGTIDQEFQNSKVLLSNYAQAIEVQSDGKILLGGGFSEVYDPNTDSFYYVYNIIRINSDGSLDTDFNGGYGDGFNNDVAVIKLDNQGRILVGGYFDYYDGDYVGYGLIRLDYYGDWDQSLSIYDGFNNGVWSIAVQPDNKIVVGGDFDTYYPNPFSTWYSYYLTRINDDGTPDTKFNTNVFGDGFDNSVYTINVDSNGDLIVGGSFSYYYCYDSSIQTGNGGSVVRLFASSDYTLYNSSPCTVSDSNTYMYVPNNVETNKLDVFFTGNEDDENHVFVFPTPFDVNFLGITYNQVNISSNAYISFGDGGNPGNCCFNIPDDIPSQVELRGIYPSVNGMDAQLFNLLSGLTENGNVLTIRWVGTYHSGYYSDVPNLILNYVFYGDNPNQIDLIIEINEHFSDGDSTGGVSDGDNTYWYGTFDSSSQTAYRINTLDGSVLPISYQELSTKYNFKGNVNNSAIVCNSLFDKKIDFSIETGSLYFGGDDHVTVTNTESLLFRNEDFTIEWFQFRQLGGGGYPRVFSIGSYGVDNGAAIAVSYEDNTDFTLWINNTAYNYGYLIDDGKWLHMAITRENNVIRVFRNGKEIFNEDYPDGIINMFDIYSDYDLVLGNEPNTNSSAQYQGYITNFRMVKGNAVYTSDFEVPTGPLSATPETTLLLLVKNGDEAFIDSSSQDQEVINSITDFNITSPFKWCCQGTVDGSGYYLNVYKLFLTDGTTKYSDCATCETGKQYALLVRNCLTGEFSYLTISDDNFQSSQQNLSQLRTVAIPPGSVLEDIINNGGIFADDGPNCYELVSYTQFLQGPQFVPWYVYDTPTACLSPLRVGSEYKICYICNSDINSGTEVWHSENTPHPIWTNGKGKAIEQLNMVELGGLNGLNN